MRGAVVRALRHWVEEDYRNPNWWYTRIGVPKAVGPALLLMGDNLPADLVAREQVLGRSKVRYTLPTAAKAAAPRSGEVRVTLPDGGLAGSTVNVALKP